MAKINSRTKGNKNERDLAKLFKAWTGKDFARTPSSGGLQWKSSNSKGDIVCTTEGHYFPFCIEAKNYKEINFEHLLIPNIKNIRILEFWAQAKRDADKANKIPILTMRYNGMPKDFHFIVMETPILKKLFYPSITPFRNKIELKVKGLNLSIIQSTEFFSTDYKKVKALAKQHLGYGKK
jgi:Holliday junction resolvase